MGAVVVVFDLIITERWPCMGRSVGMVSSYSSSSSISLWVVIQNPADVLSPTHTRSPSDLLMAHAMCSTHTVSIADR